MDLKVVFILSLIVNQAFGQVNNLDQRITVKSSLSQDTIAIGDQIVFNIKTVIPDGYSIMFPPLSDSLTKNVEIISKAKIDSVDLGNSLQEYSFSTLITSFESGTFTIPSLPLIVNNDTIYTDSLLLSVFILPKDTTIKDIYDIKAPISEPLTFAEVAPWAGGGLLLAAVIFLLVLYFRSRKLNKPFVLLQKPSEPPHITAVRKLDEIKAKKLWASDNHKLYYTMLTDVLRQYIEGRFLVAAMEQTTDEIIGDLRKLEVNSEEVFGRLHDLLMVSDLVKFAKFIPVIHDNERYLNFAYEFIHLTKQEIVSESVDMAQSDDKKKNVTTDLSTEVTDKKVN